MDSRRPRESAAPCRSLRRRFGGKAHRVATSRGTLRLAGLLLCKPERRDVLRLGSACSTQKRFDCLLLLRKVESKFEARHMAAHPVDKIRIAWAVPAHYLVFLMVFLQLLVEPEDCE